MPGWPIFAHAVRMIMNNLGTVARFSVPIWAALALAMLLVRPAQTVDPAGWAGSPPAGAIFGVIAVAIVYVIASTAIAVVWHRYVLLNEAPAGYLPAAGASLIWNYFWTGVLNGLVVALIIIVPGIVGGLMVAAISPALAPILVIGITFLANWAFFRLGPRLPASALGDSMGVRACWALTRPHNEQILGLSVAVAILFGVWNMAVSLVGIGATLVGALIQSAGELAALLIAASVLTTLYGTIVEGREV